MDGLSGGSAAATAAVAAANAAASVGDENSWEAILAALEADIRAAERAMRAPVTVSPAVLHGPPAPAQASLPWSGVLTAMPPIHTMPPIPPELETRIRDLRNRIVALQLQLRDELATLHGALTVRPRPVAPVDSGPRFFDSRM